MAETKKRRIAITVDVEAHKPRAAKDHVSRLVWGRQHGQELGIQAMMDMADKLNVPLTFFLDYPEIERYGQDIVEVGQEIVRRGHDLEPHCHPEYLLKPLFGLDDPLAFQLHEATLAQSLIIVDWLIEQHLTICGQKPLAYRSGAYLIGSNFLDALHSRGIRLDASYNLAFPENPLPLGLRGPFRWKNGLWEIPVPAIPFFHGRNHIVPWNFNAKCFLEAAPEENAAMHMKWLDTWFRRHGDDAIPTLVMHSWSFWQVDAEGRYALPAPENRATFELLLAMLKDSFEIITLGQLAQAGPSRGLERVDPNDNRGHCPICFEPVGHFEDYNSPKRRCRFCGSVERQRTLVDLLYAGQFGPQLFHNKDILHLAPGWPERLLLRRMHGARVTTLNILPGCDIQADLQAMPEVADNSFDIVLASEVFRHVRDLDAALAEICRVLRPGGLLLCSDCLQNADTGYQITDRATQTAWYGEDKLKEYGIGDFRAFGRKDWEKPFTPLFHTRIFKAIDKGTGSPAWWMACTPKKQPIKHNIGAVSLQINCQQIFQNKFGDTEHA